ncbi:hypothetical protein THASP1DRAFT_28324 [Thamnocephalis sphaerospora]|uniref:Uncharacterized protein n=1 Tax=Thamnocephalis sphaerospora TaxID=78915 RepID=A0A4P9XLZ9_9FUNG|nr:hypothetical protein THASP1DRAFT_31862 [Thamnocephalis sphaerospora]RKP06875.1 hypothetical protein THASP1DRAFT_31309 [Thamnocephalis sphaerospora]RKP09895.1 hypothetical protein THASP1DRAFT_28324 [Thamnocephalis sphaerospora]|eukprot:RKP06316.1 hypothetical protein THASP1DRAFT_31862 [Thamnocephalis sphaerospora]
MSQRSQSPAPPVFLTQREYSSPPLGGSADESDLDGGQDGNSAANTPGHTQPTTRTATQSVDSDPSPLARVGTVQSKVSRQQAVADDSPVASRLRRRRPTVESQRFAPEQQQTKAQQTSAPRTIEPPQQTASGTEQPTAAPSIDAGMAVALTLDAATSLPALPTSRRIRARRPTRGDVETLTHMAWQVVRYALGIYRIDGSTQELSEQDLSDEEAQSMAEEYYHDMQSYAQRHFGTAASFFSRDITDQAKASETMRNHLRLCVNLASASYLLAIDWERMTVAARRKAGIILVQLAAGLLCYCVPTMWPRDWLLCAPVISIKVLALLRTSGKSWNTAVLEQLFPDQPGVLGLVALDSASAREALDANSAERIHQFEQQLEDQQQTMRQELTASTPTRAMVEFPPNDLIAQLRSFLLEIALRAMQEQNTDTSGATSVGKGDRRVSVPLAMRVIQDELGSQLDVSLDLINVEPVQQPQPTPSQAHLTSPVQGVLQPKPTSQTPDQIHSSSSLPARPQTAKPARSLQLHPRSADTANFLQRLASTSEMARNLVADPLEDVMRDIEAMPEYAAGTAAADSSPVAATPSRTIIHNAEETPLHALAASDAENTTESADAVSPEAPNPVNTPKERVVQSPFTSPSSTVFEPPLLSSTPERDTGPAVKPAQLRQRHASMLARNATATRVQWDSDQEDQVTASDKETGAKSQPHRTSADEEKKDDTDETSHEPLSTLLRDRKTPPPSPTGLLGYKSAALLDGNPDKESTATVNDDMDGFAGQLDDSEQSNYAPDDSAESADEQDHDGELQRLQSQETQSDHEFAEQHTPAVIEIQARVVNARKRRADSDADFPEPASRRLAYGSTPKQERNLAAQDGERKMSHTQSLVVESRVQSASEASVHVAEEPYNRVHVLGTVGIRPGSQARLFTERKPWTREQLEALEKGMAIYGTNWKRIQERFGGPSGPLSGRNPVQLKDKARNERRYRESHGLHVGVFAKATYYRK